MSDHRWFSAGTVTNNSELPVMCWNDQKNRFYVPAHTVSARKQILWSLEQRWEDWKAVKKWELESFVDLITPRPFYVPPTMRKAPKTWDFADDPFGPGDDIDYVRDRWGHWWRITSQSRHIGLSLKTIWRDIGRGVDIRHLKAGIFEAEVDAKGVIHGVAYEITLADHKDEWRTINVWATGPHPLEGVEGVTTEKKAEFDKLVEEQRKQAIAEERAKQEQQAQPQPAPAPPVTPPSPPPPPQGQR